MENQIIEFLFGVIIVYGSSFFFGFGILIDLLEGFCLGVTGKLPTAHLRDYRKELRRKRAIAREERRKSREEKKKRK